MNDWWMLQHFGVAVGAVTGVLAARGKHVDLFGVIVLALVTAFGGGTIRDCTLGDFPVFWIKAPHYIYTAVGSALITFFTAGPKEVHAWTIPRGSLAPQAAGAIHSDFEKGFIRAEIMKYEDLKRLGSEQAIKENGLLHIEGKEYVICTSPMLSSGMMCQPLPLPRSRSTARWACRDIPAPAA